MMIHITFLLIACPAERLGVELPAGGVDAISHEDLQRDAFALSRADADAGEAFTRRMGQMNLTPKQTGEGHVCAFHEGREEGAARVVVAPWPTNPAEAAEAAVLISLAKGWDGPLGPRRPTWLCMAKPGAPLPDGERAEGVDVEADRLEAIDYTRLRDDTKKRFTALSQ